MATFGTININKGPNFWRCNKNVKHFKKCSNWLRRLKKTFLASKRTNLVQLQSTVCTVQTYCKYKTLGASILPSFVSLQKAVQKPNDAWSRKHFNRALSELRLSVIRIWFIKWQHNFPSPQRRQQLWTDRTNKNAFRFSKITAVQVSTKTFVHLLRR